MDRVRQFHRVRGFPVRACDPHAAALAQPPTAPGVRIQLAPPTSLARKDIKEAEAEIQKCKEQ